MMGLAMGRAYPQNKMGYLFSPFTLGVAILETTRIYVKPNDICTKLIREYAFMVFSCLEFLERN